MKNMENMGKNERGDNFMFEKSYDDGNGCIHVPVYMPIRNGRPDVDTDIDDQAVNQTMAKHEKKWSRRWKTLSSSKGVEEYLFFYEK